MNRVNQRNFADLDHYDRFVKAKKNNTLTENDLPLAEITESELAWQYANEPTSDAMSVNFDA